MTLCHVRAALAALALMLPGVAAAQRTPLYQDGGNLVAGDALKFQRNGVVQRAGGLTGDTNGKGLNPFSVTDSLGPGVCFNSAATTGQYNALCFGHDADGNGLITIDSAGGLASKLLYLRVNGSTYQLPGAGGGSAIAAPTSTTVGGVATWGATDGSALADSGIAALVSLPANTVLGNPLAVAGPITYLPTTGGGGNVVTSGYTSADTADFGANLRVQNFLPQITAANSTLVVSPGSLAGQYNFSSVSSDGATHNYAAISNYARTVTAGAEDGDLRFTVYNAGTATQQLRIADGLSATAGGTTYGAGTFSLAAAGGLYNDSTPPTGTGAYVRRISADLQTPVVTGTATNDDAGAGKVGEYISSSVATASGVSLTTDTAADVTSVSLTAGDWDVCGNVGIAPDGGASTTQEIVGWISTSSATAPGYPNGGAYTDRIDGGAGSSTGEQYAPVGCRRYSLASTTTVYLSVKALFSAGANKAAGFIGARRMR